MPLPDFDKLGDFDDSTVSRLTTFLEEMKSTMPDLSLWDGSESLDVDQMIEEVRGQQ